MSRDKNAAVALIAIITVVIIVIIVIIFITMPNGRLSTENTSEAMRGITRPASLPSASDVKKDLTSRQWDAIVITLNTPGVAIDTSTTKAEAVFDYDNGIDIKMQMQWLTDSAEYVLYDWDLTASRDGYSAKWKNSTGDIRYMVITPRPRGCFGISVYGPGNALTRIIHLS